MDVFYDALNRVADKPNLYEVVHRNVRQALIRIFPFAIYFLLSNDEIEVIAVFHASRDPDEWKRRSV